MILINTVFLILQDVDLVFMKNLELCGFVSSFFSKEIKLIYFLLVIYGTQKCSIYLNHPYVYRIKVFENS